jgi:hypothetical protein
MYSGRKGRERERHPDSFSSFPQSHNTSHIDIESQQRTGAQDKIAMAVMRGFLNARLAVQLRAARKTTGLGQQCRWNSTQSSQTDGKRPVSAHVRLLIFLLA